jgi:hypothetical protein
MRALPMTFGFLIATLAFAPAQAQMICGQHTDVISKLKNNYEEQPVGMGLSTDGGLIEIYSSENGTWTILITRPSGVSCLVAAGDSWEELKSTVPALGKSY